MFASPDQVAAAQMKRMMQFPPDPMLWGMFMWSQWAAWMTIMGFDLQAWSRMLESGLPVSPAAPAGPMTPSAANDGAEVKPMPDSEPVQPSFA